MYRSCIAEKILSLSEPKKSYYYAGRVKSALWVFAI